MNKSTTTGTVNLCFIVKPVVNDVNKVVKDFLIAAEGKERDNAAKKVIKTIKVAADQASKNKVITSQQEWWNTKESSLQKCTNNDLKRPKNR